MSTDTGKHEGRTVSPLADRVAVEVDRRREAVRASDTADGRAMRAGVRLARLTTAAAGWSA